MQPRYNLTITNDNPYEELKMKEPVLQRSWSCPPVNWKVVLLILSIVFVMVMIIGSIANITSDHEYFKISPFLFYGRGRLNPNCAPGQILRTCSTFESFQGGVAGIYDTSPYIETPCFCPGHGPQSRSFVIYLTKGILPNPLVPGTNRTVLLINGTTPGPIINVSLWDWVDVLVVNNIPDESTSIHWHGIILNTGWSEWYVSMFDSSWKKCDISFPSNCTRNILVP